MEQIELIPESKEETLSRAKGAYESALAAFYAADKAFSAASRNLIDLRTKYETMLEEKKKEREALNENYQISE